MLGERYLLFLCFLIQFDHSLKKKETAMKLSLEISKESPPDAHVVIKASELTEEVLALQREIAAVIDRHGGGTLSVHLGDTDYYIPHSKVIFAETLGGKVTVHTKEKMYYSELKLYELEEILPKSFARISKSGIASLSEISSVKRNLSGSAEIGFFGCEKTVFVSRGYFHSFETRLKEIRNIH